MTNIIFYPQVMSSELVERVSGPSTNCKNIYAIFDTYLTLQLQYNFQKTIITSITVRYHEQIITLYTHNLSLFYSQA